MDKDMNYFPTFENKNILFLRHRNLQGTNALYIPSHVILSMILMI